MRPSTPSNSTVKGPAGIRNLSSPVPYLFGGLALMLALIAAALLILACSYRKNSSSSAAADGEKPAKTAGTEEDSEPKIVVIMAGDSNPTYLAKPVLPSTSNTERERQSV